MLVHEVFLHSEMKAGGKGRTEKGIDNVAAYHTLSSDMGKVARDAEARVLVLNHFVPVVFDKQRLVAEIGADFSAPIVVGEDLMSLDLATGTLEHAGGHVSLPWAKP